MLLTTAAVLLFFYAIALLAKRKPGHATLAVVGALFLLHLGLQAEGRSLPPTSPGRPTLRP